MGQKEAPTQASHLDQEEILQVLWGAELGVLRRNARTRGNRSIDSPAKGEQCSY